jgi:hypothetical protein
MVKDNFLKRVQERNKINETLEFKDFKLEYPRLSNLLRQAFVGIDQYFMDFNKLTTTTGEYDRFENELSKLSVEDIGEIVKYWKTGENAPSTKFGAIHISSLVGFLDAVELRYKVNR